MRRRILWALTLLALHSLTGNALAQSSVPTPESVLGFEVGADFHLASFDQTLDYFQELEAATDRLELETAGTSSFGLPMVVAFISSEENLRELDRYKEISRRLAHPEGLVEEEARRLADEGKAIVHIDGGLHSTEVAGGQHTIELAYQLLTGDDDPEIRAILDNVIFMLWPCINPDGGNMVAEWYMNNVGTPYEVAPMPRLYQKYIGHDNNRDGYMINVPESRTVTRVVREWEPQVLYNHHQTAPFPARIWIPPFAEPISPHVHPLMWRTVNLMGMSMAQALEERGQEGAMHMGTFDNWYPGFIDHAHNFHNVASFLTETGLYRYATPHFYTVNDFPDRARGLRPESLYPSPWEGGWWRLADAVDYMVTASFSVLDFAAKYKWDLLYNRYQAGRDVIARYSEDPPYGFFIEQDQRDPAAAAEMLRRLAFNGIEIHRLVREVDHYGRRLPAGTWVIPMDQPFANFVRQLFDIQEYPDLREYPDGPIDQPYDVSGWTLYLQMGVDVVEAQGPLGDAVRGAMEPVSGEAVPWTQEGDAASFDVPLDSGFDEVPAAAGIRPPDGRLRGSGRGLLLDPAQNNTFRALNRAWEAGGKVQLVGGQPGTPLHYLVTGVDGDTQEEWVAELALQAERSSQEGIEVRRPRVGLFRPWSPSIDEGWARWLLERFEFDFRSMRNEDVKAGGLKERYDVVILADYGSRTILEGFRKGSVPPRYAGGIGEMGVRHLEEFVEEGGTLVTVNGSSRFAMEHLHLPVRDVTRGLPSTEFTVAGSVLAVETDLSHPIMAGMREEARIMMDRGPVYDTEEGFEGSVLARYQEHGNPLLSGYLLGPEHMRGYAAALSVEKGRGRVVLFGYRPYWRGQPFDTFRSLFNAVLYQGPSTALSGDPSFGVTVGGGTEDEGGDR
ncbi:MAG: M14 family metallopeptidase [bacterium]